MLEVIRRWGFRLLPVLLLGLAAAVLWREFHDLRPQDLAAEIADWSPRQLAAAAGLTVFSYGVLAVIEWFGLRWAGVHAPFRVALMGSFCANAFAHTVGFAIVIGSAVRARLYTRHGASLVTVAQTSVFYGVAFGVGMLTLGGLALVSAPAVVAADLKAPVWMIRAAGATLMLVPVAYITACALLRRVVRIGGREITLPAPQVALVQSCLGLVDCTTTAAVAWVLLPNAVVGFASYAAAYAAATMIGLISHVPGGAGVFEGAMLTLLPETPRATLAAGFLGYRLIYYVAPLALAALVLARSSLGKDVKLRWLEESWRAAGPPLISVAAFGLGVLLILTGIGRIAPERLALLRATVPVYVLESSHLISLISGLALIASAMGLFRRRAQAATVAAIASAVGASTALLRGLDVGPAVTAGILFVVIASSRSCFRRHGAWGRSGLVGWWLLAAAAVFIGTVGLGLWIYADTPYETTLWADVGYHADPARFLRSIAVMGAALLAAGAWVLARAGGPTAAPAPPEAIEAIRGLVAASPDTTAHLALTGDKAILVSPDGDAFVQYSAEGRSLVTMGDPIGDRKAGRDLLWRLKEIADRADAHVVVYHASPAWLIEYLDLGLSPLKLGDEARVSLNDFSLEGPRRRSIRQSYAKALREGLTFEIVSPPQSADLMHELQAISDAWLIEHGAREKGFSLGWFDPAALAREPIALVRREGRILAFANIWTGGRDEASIDLMRHLPQSPPGVMDFLFVELIQWAKAQGYGWFNLGLAPLTGLAEHPLAPLWHKFARQVARRGGRFYGFLGLRSFKAKFDPVWTPRYLAAPPLSLASAIVDVTRLVGRPPPTLAPSPVWPAVGAFGSRRPPSPPGGTLRPNTPAGALT